MQKNASGPLISIVCPVFNTNEKHFKEMLDSIIAQSYSNWELCLYNASSPSNSTYAIIDEYMAKDSRIKSVNGENLGISENSNGAMDIATGEFVALMDHDDILLPNALYEVNSAIQNGAEMIYSDEAIFLNDNFKQVRCTIKPDFQLEFLRNDNFICHFTTIKHSILTDVGNFHPEFDGSQDHDLFLRCVEKTQNVYHINKVLYLWRQHLQSFSHSKISACIETGKAAVQAHLKRCGESGVVHNLAGETRYYIKKEK